MKLEVASLVLSAVAVGAVLLSVSESRRASSGITALSERVVRLEAAVPAGASAAAGPSNAELAREIALMRAQISQQPLQSFGPRKEPVVKAPLDPEAAARAKAEEEKKQKEWLEKLTFQVTKNLTEKLELSTQQQTQISAIVEVQVAAYRAAQFGKKPDEAKKALEDVRTETNERIHAQLTVEQRAKYDEIARRPGGIFNFPLPTPLAPGEGSHSDDK